MEKLLSQAFFFFFGFAAACVCVVCAGPSLSSYENILSMHLAPFLAQILSVQVIFSTFWLRCLFAPLPPPLPGQSDV